MKISNSEILVELQSFMGSDLEIARSAWTSTYDKDKIETKELSKAESLVPRLIKEGHGTPIESVIFRFWIRMPIFVDRQHMTHRMASHNGLSGRYRTMPEDWFSMPKDVQDIFEKADCFGDWQASKYEEVCRYAFENYKLQLSYLKKAEEKGMITNKEFKRAREIIRGQLPTAGMVERTTIMNLRSFANYQKQRNSDYAQLEIKRVAELMLNAVESANVCPIAINTLKEIGWKI